MRGAQFPTVTVVVLIILFAGLATAVSLNLTLGFDRAILLSLRNSANLARPGPEWLAETMRDITSLGSVVAVLIFAVTISGYWLLNGDPRAAALLLGSAIGALVLNEILKLAIDRPRPDAVLQAARVFSSGFPSGHATLSSTTYFLTALLLEHRAREWTRVWLMAAATLVVLAIGFSRIYLGLHYPADILGGWCVGAAWVCCCYPAIRRLRPH